MIISCGSVSVTRRCLPPPFSPRSDARKTRANENIDRQHRPAIKQSNIKNQCTRARHAHEDAKTKRPGCRHKRARDTVMRPHLSRTRKNRCFAIMVSGLLLLAPRRKASSCLDTRVVSMHGITCVGVPIGSPAVAERATGECALPAECPISRYV